MMPPLLSAWILWYLLLSAIAFGAFAWDKWSAKQGRRRIPEKTLLWMSWLGGFPGAFAASSMLRHKTQKYPFLHWLRRAPWAHFLMALVALLVWALLPR